MNRKVELARNLKSKGTSVSDKLTIMKLKRIIWQQVPMTIIKVEFMIHLTGLINKAKVTRSKSHFSSYAHQKLAYTYHKEKLNELRKRVPMAGS